MSRPAEPVPPNSSEGIYLALSPLGRLQVRATLRNTGNPQTHAVKLPFALIGRIPQAGVCLDDPSVSRCHALLQLVDGVPYCIDLGSRTGVLWDDGGQGRGWIHPGQTVQIGMFDVQADAVDIPPRPTLTADEAETNSQPPVLEVYSHAGTSGRFALELPVTLIGRHPNCNLRFLDEGVAYFQCSLVRTQRGVWCVDLLSRTGTAINGRFARVAPLRDGDLIELGKVSFVFRNASSHGQSLVAPSAGGFPSKAFGMAFAPDKPAGTEILLAAFREIIEQFQQSFVSMARMFTTMQQEHTAMMCEQMRHIQELLIETRAAKSPPAAASTPVLPPATSASPPPASPAPTVAKIPTTTPVGPEAASRLADAHTWFLDRLGQKGVPPGVKPS